MVLAQPGRTHLTSLVSWTAFVRHIAHNMRSMRPAFWKRTFQCYAYYWAIDVVIFLNTTILSGSCWCSSFLGDKILLAMDFLNISTIKLFIKHDLIHEIFDDILFCVLIVVMNFVSSQKSICLNTSGWFFSIMLKYMSRKIFPFLPF